MGYPQIILLAYFSAQVMYTMLNHGSTYTVSATRATASTACTVLLLVLGGFFDSWGIAQLSYVPMTVLSVGTCFILNGQKQVLNFYAAVISATILLAWYWSGGFFS